MIRKQEGFTLVELMISMAIFTIVMVSVTTMFGNVLSSFKNQSRILESNIEGIVGLELLRSDIEQAGFGLPFDLNGVTYTAEAANDANTTWNDTVFNDGTSNVPRGLVITQSSGSPTSNMSGFGDVLVIRATNVATNSASHKWTEIVNAGGLNTITTWSNPDDNLVSGTDRVIVIQPVKGARQRLLINSGGAFSTTFQSAAGSFAGAFQPDTSSNQTYLIYGIGTAAPTMPFNRADYYIRNPGAGIMPSRCISGTGILYKGVINHTSSGGSHTEYPLLDCVAKMRVVLKLDMDDNGTAGTAAAVSNTGNTIVFLTTEGAGVNQTTIMETLADPELLRKRIKEVRVYILAQVGQTDMTYTSDATIAMPDPEITGETMTVPNTNARWKIYSLIARPYNLR